MKVKVKWIWLLIWGALFVSAMIMLFVNVKTGLILALIALAVLILNCLLIFIIGLNTKVKFGAAKIISMADNAALTETDKKVIHAIESKAEKLNLPSTDGLEMEALLLEHPDPKGLVYLCHGFGDYQMVSVRLPIYQFYQQGYSIFVSYSRGFGAHNGCWTGMGVLERDDHIQWLKYLKNRFPDLDFFLYGVSMGAASVMNLSDLDDPQIKGIIEDCGYVDLYDQMDHCLKHVLQIPEWPALPAADFFCKRICRYSLKDLNVRHKLANTRYPILAFHGREDDFVPFYNLDRVIAAGKDNVVDAHFIEGAAHLQSFQVNPEFYWNTVSKFLARCQNEPQTTAPQTGQNQSGPLSSDSSSTDNTADSKTEEQSSRKGNQASGLSQKVSF